MSKLFIRLILSITTITQCFGDHSSVAIISITNTTSSSDTTLDVENNSTTNTHPNTDTLWTYLVYGIIAGAFAALYCILMAICIYCVLKKRQLENILKTKTNPNPIHKSQVPTSSPTDEDTSNSTQSYPTQLKDEYDLTANTINNNINNSISSIDESNTDTLQSILKHVLAEQSAKNFNSKSETDIVAAGNYKYNTQQCKIHINCDNIITKVPMHLASPTDAETSMPSNESFASEPATPMLNSNDENTLNMLDESTMSSSLRYNCNYTNFMYPPIQHSQPIPINGFRSNVNNYEYAGAQYGYIRRNQLHPVQLRMISENRNELDLIVSGTMHENVGDVEETFNSEVMENILKNVLDEQSVVYYESTSETDAGNKDKSDTDESDKNIYCNEMKDINDDLSVYLANDIIDVRIVE